jgi:hypothetical protein
MLREEHRLRMFENRVLGRTYALNRYEVIRGCRKVNDEGLHK